MSKKLFLSFILFICMFTVMPKSVLAVGNEASIGGVEYPTLKEALETGGNVTLLQDVEINTAIEVTKPTVLNMGNHTITSKVSKGRAINVKTTSFTINANDGGITIDETVTDSYGLINVISATEFIINGGNYTGNTFSDKNNTGSLINFEGNTSDAKIELNNLNASSNGEIVYFAETFNNLSAMNINGGTYITDTRAFLIDVIDYENSPVVFDGVTITTKRGPCIEMSGANSTLIDCNFTVTGDFSGGYSWSRSAIGIGFEGRVNVKSGAYRANSENMGLSEGYGIYIYSSGGIATIDGGTFSGSTAAARADVGTSYNDDAIIYINDGEFEGDLLHTNTGMEDIIVRGGFFDRDPSTFLDEDIAIASITKSGDADPSSWSVGTKSIEKAARNANAGDKLSITGDANFTGIPEGVAITNDGDGTITVNGITVKPEETLIVPAPSIPSSRPNYESIDPCAERIGSGWVYDETKGHCVYKGSGQMIPNTSTK